MEISYRIRWKRSCKIHLLDHVGENRIAGNALDDIHNRLDIILHSQANEHFPAQYITLPNQPIWIVPRCRSAFRNAVWRTAQRVAFASIAQTFAGTFADQIQLPASLAQLPLVPLVVQASKADLLIIPHNSINQHPV